MAENREALYARQKELRQANIEETRRKDREYQRKDYAAHPEKYKVRRERAKSAPGYKAKQSAAGKLYYQANKDLCKARSREWKSNNSEWVRVRDRALYERNAEERRASSLEYYYTHKDQLRDGKKRNKAHRRTLGRIPNGWFDRQLVVQNDRCAGCLVRFSVGLTAATLDHIQPVKAGGTNAVENLHLLCKSCNSSKQAQGWQQWLAERHGRLL